MTAVDVALGSTAPARMTQPDQDILHWILEQELDWVLQGVGHAEALSGLSSWLNSMPKAHETKASARSNTRFALLCLTNSLKPPETLDLRVVKALRLLWHPHDDQEEFWCLDMSVRAEVVLQHLSGETKPPCLPEFMRALEECFPEQVCQAQPALGECRAVLQQLQDWSRGPPDGKAVRNCMAAAGMSEHSREGVVRALHLAADRARARLAPTALEDLQAHLTSGQYCPSGGFYLRGTAPTSPPEVAGGDPAADPINMSFLELLMDASPTREGNSRALANNAARMRVQFPPVATVEHAVPTCVEDLSLLQLRRCLFHSLGEVKISNNRFWYVKRLSKLEPSELQAALAATIQENLPAKRPRRQWSSRQADRRFADKDAQRAGPAPLQLTFSEPGSSLPDSNAQSREPKSRQRKQKRPRPEPSDAAQATPRKERKRRSEVGEEAGQATPKRRRGRKPRSERDADQPAEPGPMDQAEGACEQVEGRREEGARRGRRAHAASGAEPPSQPGPRPKAKSMETFTAWPLASAGNHANQRRSRKPRVWVRADGAKVYTRAETAKMNKHMLKQAFTEVFGEECKSENQAWIRARLCDEISADGAASAVPLGRKPTVPLRLPSQQQRQQPSHQNLQSLNQPLQQPYNARQGRRRQGRVGSGEADADEATVDAARGSDADDPANPDSGTMSRGCREGQGAGASNDGGQDPTRPRRGAGLLEYCLVCGEGGTTLRCEACKFVFHAQCAGISAESLPHRWMCTRCRHAAASQPNQEEHGSVATGPDAGDDKEDSQATQDEEMVQEDEQDEEAEEEEDEQDEDYQHQDSADEGEDEDNDDVEVEVEEEEVEEEELEAVSEDEEEEEEEDEEEDEEEEEGVESDQEEESDDEDADMDGGVDQDANMDSDAAEEDEVKAKEARSSAAGGAVSEEEEEDEDEDLDEGDEGDDSHEDCCGICQEGGSVLCCDSCPLVFHHRCVGLKKTPRGEWHCPDCLSKAPTLPGPGPSSCVVCFAAVDPHSALRLDCDYCAHKMLLCSMHRNHLHQTVVSETGKQRVVQCPDCHHKAAGREPRDPFANEDVCNVCKKGGALVMCDGCPAAYHLRCMHSNDQPVPMQDQWFCPSCSRSTSAPGPPAVDPPTSPTLGTGRTQKPPWSEEEVAALKEGVAKHGTSWTRILNEHPLIFMDRDTTDLKNKYRRMLAQQQE